MVCHANGMNLARLLQLKDDDRIRTLSVRCCAGPLDMAILAALKHVPHLESLHLDLAGCHITNFGAKRLSQLKQAPKLTTLDLDLAQKTIGINGVEALAGLKDAAALRRLKLNLQSNAFNALLELSSIQGAAWKITLERIVINSSAPCLLQSCYDGDVGGIQAALQFGSHVHMTDDNGFDGLIITIIYNNVCIPQWALGCGYSASTSRGRCAGCGWHGRHVAYLCLSE